MFIRLYRLWMIAALCAAPFVLPVAHAQPAPKEGTPPRTVEERVEQLTSEVAELKNLVRDLQAQVAAQAQLAAQAPSRAPAPASAAPGAPGTAVPSQPPSQPPFPPAPVALSSAPPKANADVLRGLTVNGMIDGYYEYNTNNPIGRVNYLRAYDVSSNSFSLNQADLIVESAPDPDAGKRTGMRIDLQYGQATSTLQGNPDNELRPAIYRNIFQAYGTYVFPVGTGLSVDFGKWASSLGLEGNYTKDQLNYSRSFWFDYLPFYHMGLRAKYAVNDELTINAWITNGTNQTEAFNNYKDQLIGFVLTPAPEVSWTVNFYNGQEHPDVAYITNPSAAQKTLPNQQGTYVLPLINPPNGRLDILDNYITWQATKALTLAAEGDYVQERLYSYSPAQHVSGGALYGGYQLTPRIALAARLEYLGDVGGLYTGATQYLKEGTFTIDYRPASDFLMRAEFRRDASNQRYFLSDTLGLLDTSQQTIGLGLVWWFGQKAGAW